MLLKLVAQGLGYYAYVVNTKCFQPYYRKVKLMEYFFIKICTWRNFALNIEPDFDEAECEWPDFPDFLI